MIQKSHNLKIAKTLALSTVLGLSLANIAHAAEALSVNLQAKQIVTENGKQVLKTVNRAKSGDVIQYQAIYRNNIQKPMTDLALTLPVPANMVYVSSSSLRLHKPVQMVRSLRICQSCVRSMAKWLKCPHRSIVRYAGLSRPYLLSRVPLLV